MFALRSAADAIHTRDDRCKPHQKAHAVPWPRPRLLHILLIRLGLSLILTGCKWIRLSQGTYSRGTHGRFVPRQLPLYPLATAKLKRSILLYLICFSASRSGISSSKANVEGETDLLLLNPLAMIIVSISRMAMEKNVTTQQNAKKAPISNTRT